MRPVRALVATLSIMLLQLSCWAASSATADSESTVSELKATRGTSDFNGDGYTDLAAGAWATNQDAGAVHVIYGSGSGLTATGDQLWTLDSPGIKGTSKRGESSQGVMFGASLAAGNFNGDRFADLAIGSPGHNWAAGAVSILYGSRRGLTAAGDQFWTRDSPGIKGVAEPDVFDNGGQHFGTALTAGDIDQDGFADLAIGTPGYGGSVNVLYGSRGGLSASGDQLWSQNSPGIIGESDGGSGMDIEPFIPGDSFGSSLAIGNFGGTSQLDLAIGVPGDNRAGAVNVIYGSKKGLHAAGNELLTPKGAGLIATNDDYFGAALVAANFGGSLFDDLAVATPSYHRTTQRGIVSVLYGSPQGLDPGSHQSWSHDTRGIQRPQQNTVGFGLALAAADFGGSEQADLAISAASWGGSVHILFGTASGLTASKSQVWSRSTPGVKGATQPELGWGPPFGATLAAGQFGRSRWSDLAIGAPTSYELRGSINILYGSKAGLTAQGDQLWTRNSPGIKGKARTGDHFGDALTG